MINKEIRLFFKYNNDYLNVNYNDIIKIPYFFQLLEDRTYDEYKELEINKIDINNFKLILDFIKIENQSIKDYIKEIEQVSYYTTSIMPSSLNNYLSVFDIKNEKEHDTMIINKMISFKEDCNYLQYDLLGDVIEYKWADNYRIMDRTNLNEILKDNINNIFENFKEIDDESFINLNSLENKIQEIIIEYHQNSEITKITKKDLRKILDLHITTIIEDLNYII